MPRPGRRQPGTAKPEAVVLDALRTPFGRRGGALSGWHPIDLGAELLGTLLAASGAHADLVEDVILGCTSQVGAQAYNIARRAALAAGWPESVPGVTVDCQASSSIRAVQWGAQAVVSGTCRLVVAGGVEVMSTVPLGAPLAQPAIGKPFGLRLVERYRGGGGLLPPGLVAEEVARRWSLSRADLDSWALRSSERARRAQKVKPPFISPIPLISPAPLAASVPPSPARAGRRLMLVRDEALERPLRRADLSRLASAYLDGGVVTAANMAGEGDGAAAVLIASSNEARALGLVPKARLLAFATAGADPAVWPMATVPATLSVLARTGLSLGDVDRWYVHESSAAAVLAWAAATGADLDRVNVDGGALASTAPVGAAGASLFASAVADLASARNGLAVVCAAGEGGVGVASVVGQPE